MQPDQSQILNSEAELGVWAKKFALLLQPGDWVWLEGELGAGKTTLVRSILRALGFKDPVASPTYPLMLEYSLPQFRIVHIDGFRLNVEGAAAPWDPSDWKDAVVFVEWAERTRLPKEGFRWQILLETLESPNEERNQSHNQRRITLISNPFSRKTF